MIAYVTSKLVRASAAHDECCSRLQSGDLTDCKVTIGGQSYLVTRLELLEQDAYTATWRFYFDVPEPKGTTTTYRYSVGKWE